MVRTRTVVQTRTHAQKYFQKVQKSGLGPEDFEAGLDYASFTAAISQPPSKGGGSGGGSSSKKSRRPVAFAEPSSGKAGDNSSGQDDYDFLDESVGTYGLVALHNATGDLSPLNHPSRGPGASVPKTPYGNQVDFSSGPQNYTGGYQSYMSSKGNHSGVLFSASNKNRTPLPSPAACGKRKLDELSAARMMAGAQEEASTTKGSMERPIGGNYRRVSNQYTPQDPKLRLSFDANATRGSGQKISEGNSFDQQSGEPSKKLKSEDESGWSSSSMGLGLGLDGGAGLSIVNPEELRPLSPYVKGESSPPMTPWDGELKELEEKSKQDNYFKVSLSTPKQLKNFSLELKHCISSSSPKALLDLIVAAESSISASVDISVSLEESVLGGAEADMNTGQHIPAQPVSLATTLNSAYAETGETALHLACSLNPSSTTSATPENILAVCRILLEHGASTEGADRQGQTGLHRAAATGLRDVGKLLINKGAAINAIDSNGDTALHIAASYSNFSFIELLADFGCNCHVRNLQSRCAIDVAATRVKTSSDESEISAIRLQTRRLMMSTEPRHRTLVLYHYDCLKHIVRSAEDWEGPDRLEGIIAGVRNGNLFQPYELEISDRFQKADVELLQRVHSSEYIAFVNSLSKQLQNDSGDSNAKKSAVAFTPQVTRLFM